MQSASHEAKVEISKKVNAACAEIRYSHTDGYTQAQTRKRGLKSLRGLLPSCGAKLVFKEFMDSKSKFHLPREIMLVITDAFNRWTATNRSETMQPATKTAMMEIYQNLLIEGLYLMNSAMMLQAEARPSTPEVGRQLEASTIRFYQAILEPNTEQGKLIYRIFNARVALLATLQVVGSICWHLNSFGPAPALKFVYQCACFMVDCLDADKENDPNVRRAAATGIWGVLRARGMSSTEQANMQMQVLNYMLKPEVAEPAFKGLLGLVESFHYLEVRHPVVGLLWAAYTFVQKGMPERLAALRKAVVDVGFFPYLIELLFTLMSASAMQNSQAATRIRGYVLPNLIEVIGLTAAGDPNLCDEAIAQRSSPNNPEKKKQSCLQFLLRCIDVETAYKPSVDGKATKYAPQGASVDLVRSMMFAVGCIIFNSHKAQLNVASLESGRYLRMLCRLAMTFFFDEPLEAGAKIQFDSSILVTFMSFLTISMMKTALRNRTNAGILAQESHNRERSTSVVNELTRLSTTRLHQNMISLQKMAIFSIRNILVSSPPLMLTLMKSPEGFDNLFGQLKKATKDAALAYPSLELARSMKAGIDERKEIPFTEINQGDKALNADNEVVVVLSGMLWLNKSSHNHGTKITSGYMAGATHDFDSWADNPKRVVSRNTFKLQGKQEGAVLLRLPYSGLVKKSLDHYLARVLKACPELDIEDVSKLVGEVVQAAFPARAASLSACESAYQTLFQAFMNHLNMVTYILQLLAALMKEHTNFTDYLYENPELVETLVQCMFLDSVKVSNLAAGALFQLMNTHKDSATKFPTMKDGVLAMQETARIKAQDAAEQKAKAEAAAQAKAAAAAAAAASEKETKSEEATAAELLAANSVALSSGDSLKRPRTEDDAPTDAAVTKKAKIDKK